MGTGALSPGVKQSGREADHSTPASVEVKKMCMSTSTSPYTFTCSAYLVKHKDNFTFTTVFNLSGVTVIKDITKLHFLTYLKHKSCELSKYLLE
jgi:hypothetical protein